jgi:hypothetical protein
VVRAQKTDLLTLSTQDLLAQRRRLAGRLGDLEHVLFGSLVEQMRRCGKAGCRCAAGDPHGPYTFFSQRRGRRGLRYVPAAMLAYTRAYLQHGSHVETVLSEISAINVELLARRALG